MFFFFCQGYICVKFFFPKKTQVWECEMSKIDLKLLCWKCRILRSFSLDSFTCLWWWWSGTLRHKLVKPGHVWNENRAQVYDNNNNKKTITMKMLEQCQVFLQQGAVRLTQPLQSLKWNKFIAYTNVRTFLLSHLLGAGKVRSVFNYECTFFFHSHPDLIQCCAMYKIRVAHWLMHFIQTWFSVTKLP